MLFTSLVIQHFYSSGTVLKLFFKIPLCEKALCQVLYIYYIFQSSEKSLKVALVIPFCRSVSERCLSSLPKVMLEMVEFQLKPRPPQLHGFSVLGSSQSLFFPACFPFWQDAFGKQQLLQVGETSMRNVSLYLASVEYGTLREKLLCSILLRNNKS